MYPGGGEETEAAADQERQLPVQLQQRQQRERRDEVADVAGLHKRGVQQER